MSITKINDDIALLLNNGRVFVQSKNINVFPCSRRGPCTNGTLNYYDPEARLNTERTNRLRTAINGFKDDFIIATEDDTLVFVLAGYYVEVKNFNPSDIAAALGTDTNTIYAHLSLHKGISLNVENYTTEILYRQSEQDTNANYLDVSYTEDNITEDFFVGISFTKEKIDDNVDEITLLSHNLKLFSRSDDGYEVEQKSLLPKIEHGETPDSVIIGNLSANDLEVKNTTTTSTLQTNNAIVTNDAIVGHLGVGSVSATGSVTAGILSAASTTKTQKLETSVITAVPELDDKITIEEAVTLKKALTVEGATTVNNIITAEKLTITKIDETGAEKGEIKTPQLRVNRITSDEGSITVDNKKLIVNKSLEMLAKEDADNPAEATIEKAIIGDLTVKVDSKLKNSIGKITTLNLQATNNATVYDLDVGTNIDTSTLAVGSYINVGKPAISTQTTGDIVAKNNIFAENRIEAKNTIKAPTIYQTVDSIDKPVPFIDLVEQDSGCWQLQISRVNKVYKIEN